ncbi:hypothetical protein Calag_0023 [Caldisphaera lagunensis DSM 15908]|uniref:Blue (type 1) copper domain-containing protein n=1 Tax=Caldisphaera lagunensis (strain DSM 15908 / JCM 11604 / ANMR 0165 / IC-154) TaxID=1056495 RepID=L0A7H0_CALLD|nr:plastocyanin/azurin family copper-binding protein [Caldisphaera lagunensis]AFZ69818.1 hypothetical protein Calag_0023 [Caldisphaera lagunensis DSM 15908]
MNKLIWLAIILTLGLAISITGIAYYLNYKEYYNNINNYYNLQSFTRYPINESMELANEIPNYVHIYKNNNSIVIDNNNINLVVLAMMGNDAANMTNSTVPSYSHGDVFVIYGLINPTLIVPSGSTIHVLFINLDDDMYHNFIITTTPPPYPYNVMPYVGMNGGMGPSMRLYMTWLPPANYNNNYAYGYEYTFIINSPGNYWYLCTYPGHAENGMYGEVISLQ